MKQKYTRQCGGCTACCTTHEVREIHKPVCQPCQFCEEGVGCKVYGHHPKGCREFVCEWIKGFGPEDSRPDRSGVVLDLQESPALGTATLTIWEYQLGSLQSKPISNLISEAVSKGLAVICFFSVWREADVYFFGNGTSASGGEVSGQKECCDF